MLHRAKDDELMNPFKTIRLSLSNAQIELLVDYALRTGYQRKAPARAMDTSEKSLIVKWAIMSRLGFE